MLPGGITPGAKPLPGKDALLEMCADLPLRLLRFEERLPLPGGGEAYLAVLQARWPSAIRHPPSAISHQPSAQHPGIMCIALAYALHIACTFPPPAQFI